MKAQHMPEVDWEGRRGIGIPKRRRVACSEELMMSPLCVLGARGRGSINSPWIPAALATGASVIEHHCACFS